METIANSTEQIADPKPKLRWFYPTPGRLLVVLLAVEGILLLSERWFPKGWAVLIAIASLVVMIVLMLIWFIFVILFRWRFQFSIRSLFVLTIAVAIPCSWLAVERAKTREQREAVSEIDKLGGSVVYSYGGRGAPIPDWLRELLGEELFGEVQGVSFCGSNVSDENLKYLKPLEQVNMLILSDTRITNAGLAHLRNLTQLNWLTLTNTSITDTGLEFLGELRQLQHLVLEGTHVSKEGIAKLRQSLPNCEIVY